MKVLPSDIGITLFNPTPVGAGLERKKPLRDPHVRVDVPGGKHSGCEGLAPVAGLRGAGVEERIVSQLGASIDGVKRETGRKIYQIVVDVHFDYATGGFEEREERLDSVNHHLLLMLQCVTGKS